MFLYTNGYLYSFRFPSKTKCVDIFLPSTFGITAHIAYLKKNVEEFYLNSRLRFVCRRYNNSLMVWKWSGFMGCHDIWLWLRCIVAPIVLGGRRVTYLTAIYFDFVNVSVKNAHAF